MESDNRTHTQPHPDQPPNKSDVVDWRSKYSTETRRKVIHKILEGVKKHFPYRGQLLELNRIAVEFEEKIYVAAASKEDYMRKISVKLFALENRNQNSTASGSQNPMEPESQNIQIQKNNEEQEVRMPATINQPEVQQNLIPNLPRKIASSGIQSSAGVASTLPPLSVMNQSPLPNLINQNPDMPNMVDASRNRAVNSIWKEDVSSVFNNQEEVPRRLQVTPGNQQFLRQQPQQFISNSCNDNHTKQRILPNSLMQSSIRKKHQLQPNLAQLSQQAGTLNVLQQHPQYVSMQPHHQQTLLQHQHQITHQSMRDSQRQQQLQTDFSNMQSSQLLGKQNMSEKPQQQLRLIDQQDGISNSQQQHLMAQQHMGHQDNVSGIEKQLHGTRSSNLDVQPNQHQIHLVHPNKDPVSQQNLQPVTRLLENQGQHSQPPQPYIKSVSDQLQQNMAMNHQQRDVQQSLQHSGTLMQSHNTVYLQKQMYQSKRALSEASSASTDSVSQIGHRSSIDWQEEIYKKITSLKEIYINQICPLYLQVSNKLEQLVSLPQQSKEEQIKTLNAFRSKLKQILTCLQVDKCDVTPAHGEQLPNLEKLIVYVLTHVPPPMQSIQPAPSQETHQNPSLQANNIQGTVMMEQKQNNTCLQPKSILSRSGLSNVLLNMSGRLNPEPKVDSGQGSRLASLQHGVDGSMQQNSLNSQQTYITSLSARNGGNLIQPTISNRQSMSSVNQHHVKEQQMMQNQQLKHQILNRHQQISQRQQQLRQVSKHQQQVGHSSASRVLKLQTMVNMNGVTIKQEPGVKPVAFSQQHAADASQRSLYHQLKSGVSFPMSSPQMLPTSSPQILQSCCPQIDQQNMLPRVSKAGTPLQSGDSPFIVTSPSTSLAASPMQGGSEKLASNGSPLTTTGKISVQQAVNKSNLTEEPIDRLVKVVKSISNEALTASVNDIGSVVGLVDTIAGSSTGNGSTAAVGEDLVVMTKSRLQAKYLAEDKSNGSKKMKRCTSSIPVVITETNGSWHYSLTQLGSELSDLESNATTRAKKRRTEVGDSLLKEINDINLRLIETTVDISEDVNPCTAAGVASEVSQGVIVKCSFNAVALGPNLCSEFATSQLSPIKPLRLLVPSNYPNCSPVLLDKLQVNLRNESEDLSMKVRSKLSRSLRSLSQPISLREIAKTWDFCARAAISEYAQARGGGSFSSNYGSWESVF